jgi:hypothetical protein
VDVIAGSGCSWRPRSRWRGRRGSARCGLQAGGGIERGPDVEELLRVQAAAANGTLDRGPDVAGTGDPDAGALLDERSRLVGLVQRTGDEDRVCLGLEQLGDAVAGPE